MWILKFIETLIPKKDWARFLLLCSCPMILLFLIEIYKSLSYWLFIILFLIFSLFRYFSHRQKLKDKYKIFYNELKNPNHPHKDILNKLLSSKFQENKIDEIFPTKISYKNTLTAKILLLPIIFYFIFCFLILIFLVIILLYFKATNITVANFMVFWIYIIFLLISYFYYIRNKNLIEKIFIEYDELKNDYIFLYESINSLKNKKTFAKNLENSLVFSLLIFKISDNFVSRQRNLKKISYFINSYFYNLIFDFEEIKIILNNQKNNLIDNSNKIQEIIQDFSMLEYEKLEKAYSNLWENTIFDQTKSRIKILKNNIISIQNK